MAAEARDWRTAGRAALLLAQAGGSVDQAIDHLQQARPGDAGLLSDLAAAHLVRGDLDDDPRAFLDALEVADEALALDPEAPEPRHQRALALTLLGLHLQALEEWRRLAAGEDDDGWRREAAEQVERLSRPTAADLWAEAEGRVIRAVTGAEPADLDVVSLARRDPQHLRLLAEDDLLGRWGQAVVEGREGDAERVLGLLVEIAAALRRVTHDRTLSDAVTVLAAATGEGRRGLALAHLDYAEARRFHEVQDYVRAAPLFTDAETAFVAAGSSFAVWPRYYRAVIAHHQHRRREALRSQTLLRDDLPPEAIIPRAYSHWMSGLGLTYLADRERALVQYDRARALFDAVGEVENRSAMDSELGTKLSGLGRSPDAWRSHGAALAQRRQLVNSRRIQNPISGAMRVLLEEGRAAVALHFADEWLAVAMSSGTALSRTLAAEGRAVVLERLGRSADGVAELERAAEAAKRIPEAALRTESEARVALARARLLAASDPDGALRALDVTDRFARLADARQHLVPAFLLRAEVHHRRGDITAEAAVLYDAVEEIERQRGEVASPELRISYLDQRRDVLESVVTFELARDRPERALEMLERMRASELRDELARRGLGGHLRGLSEVERGLTGGRSGLAFLVLDDRLSVWHLDGSGLSLRQHPVGEERLTRLVDGFVDAVRGGGDPGREGRELAVLLLPDQPLPPDTTLVVVPDGPLHRLPLAALPLPGKEGGWLIERTQVVVAPSLNVHLDLEVRPVAPDGDAEGLLVVSGVEHDVTAFPGLPALEDWWSHANGARNGARLLRGRRATRSAFLEAFPLFRAVIFGGHALTPGGRAERGGLVLAPDGPEDDGLLEPAAILGGTRPALTEVVVLAACGTGAGTTSETEGVMSLARPFLGLGVPTVLASLWPVEDRATAEMTLGWSPPPRQGFAAALRELQIAALKARERGGPGGAALAFQVFGSAGGGTHDAGREGGAR